ncbi:MAG: hypothetical protein ISQ32_05275 [Rickettsiales bacterium]|nr:hypothetical protein [Rickettsiales bacterium]
MNIHKLSIFGSLFLLFNAPFASAETLEERVAKLERNQALINNHDLKVFGTLHFEQVSISENDTNVNLYDNSQLRHGRLGVMGDVNSEWDFKFDVDFADDNSNVIDAFIRRDLGNSSIRVGQFRQPFSLEELTSISDTTFVERASINELTPGRALGIGHERNLGNINIQAGIFGDSISSTAGDDNQNASGALRIASFVDSSDMLLHVGIAGQYFTPDGDNIYLGFRPEAAIDSSSSVIIVDEDDLDNVTRTGLELAIVRDRLSIQGEYIIADLEYDSDGDDNNIRGYYAQLSLFLTDNSRAYDTKSSTFVGLAPSSNDEAIELAYRFSNVDATDTSDGKMNSHTIGINWYPADNLRFMANYIMLNSSSDSTYGGDADIIALRAQVDF